MHHNFLAFQFPPVPYPGDLATSSVAPSQGAAYDLIYVDVGGNRLAPSTSRLWTIVIDRPCTISTAGSTLEDGSRRQSNDAAEYRDARVPARVRVPLLRRPASSSDAVAAGQSNFHRREGKP